MSKKVMFSVVIPVYNAKKTLTRAIEPLVAQKDAGLEIILVNDGSTDSSGEICDKYANKYPEFIKVFHKENGGTCTAKNLGIKYAEGEYIALCDSDDYFEEDAFFRMGEIVKKYHPDMIDFGWNFVNAWQEISSNVNGVLKEQVLNRAYIYDIILPQMINLEPKTDKFIYDFCPTKVFKTAIIKEHNIHFNENRRMWEDRPFTVEFLKYSETFYSMNASLYYYVSTPNSLGERYDLQFFDIIISTYELYRSLFVEDYDFDIPYVYEHWARAIENMIKRSMEEKRQKKEIIEEIRRTLADERVKTWFENRYARNKVEESASNYMRQNEYDAVIKLYKAEVAKEKRESRFLRFKIIIVGFLRKYLKIRR